MNKNQNRLIATARQYALVTFLGLGVSIAVAKTAIDTQKTASMNELEWVYNESGEATSPESYTLSPGTSLEDQCPGVIKVCGIKAPASSNPNEPEIEEGGDLYNRILSKDTTHDDVFLMN